MKQIVYITLCLLAPLSAHAASFDCGKAQSLVEKYVCSDNELSRLDDEVNAAYEDALKDKERAWLVEQDRAAWIAWRSSNEVCPYHGLPPECLRFTYRNQLTWIRHPFLHTTRVGELPVRGDRGIDSATLLQDGMVLLLAARMLGRTEAYLYDPAANRFSEVSPPLPQERLAFFTMLLGDGRVLTAGGWEIVLGEPSSAYSFYSPISAPELYDPSTQQFTPAGSFPSSIKGSATLLRSGKILIAGGSIPPPLIPSDRPYPVFLSYIHSGDKTQPTYSREAVLFDPATGTSVATEQLITGRILHSATLLGNGNVLIFGGTHGASPVSAEIYDSATGVFTATGAPLENRIRPATILLPNGKVLVIGGLRSWNMWPPSGVILGTAELYDPATGQFTETGKLHTLDVEWTPMLLPNGKVLVVGRSGSTEFYDPDTGEFTSAGKFTHGNQTATLLKNGKLLLMSGPFVELYDPAAGGNAPAKTGQTKGESGAVYEAPNSECFWESFCQEKGDPRCISSCSAQKKLRDKQHAVR